MPYLAARAFADHWDCNDPLGMNVWGLEVVGVDMSNGTLASIRRVRSLVFGVGR